MPALTDPKLLREIPLFQDISEEILQAVNRRLRRHVFPTGSNVITFETPGEVVYIILSGTVKIKVDQSDGREVIVAILGPGELVGELAVLDGDIRSADVITQEDSVLLWIDRAGFQDLLKDHVEITNNLLRILTRRVRVSTEQIQALNTLDVTGKVARQLLVFAEQYGRKVSDGILIPLRLTQSDISYLVGASRERVNQVFVQLRQFNAITVDGQYRITVNDIKRLQTIIASR